ncbi:hypothetical protein [Vibrio sp. 10N.261.52.A1]|uniref:hypothetical protein n=1 Tax=Vibrio TaxID=662 RepID=UPI000C853694|nr:hypothetical protein [Vibrio sp. 10N.261.52.A1]PML35129.1 hypothetical protein BCT81_19085 [Vibrio sp. 10N.261.52.A1]
MTYDASSITIKSEQEAGEEFIWLRVGRLAETYPTVSQESIEMGLRACQLSGESEFNYETRYLQGNRDHRVTPEFQACYMQLVKEKRSKLKNA